ncbi:MAG: serine/threonine-protein phosphatase [Acidobacteria bacterium]|nr:serine/threonine-protein phosphatase [Acidobacteriota bacterium]
MSAAEHVSAHLIRTLTATDGLNDFFEKTIPLLATHFGAECVQVVDYRENTGHFDLLYFIGYSNRSRFELQRRLGELDIQRSLTETEPYFAGNDDRRLYLPLYFMSTLEAVIIFEAESPITLTAAGREVAKVASKFIGLLMSSSRLAINQTGGVDINDLHRARQIQLTYLPSENLETERYEVFGYNQSSSLVGGDYFDYFRTRENSIQCVLADASGHGLSAALIMSTFRALLHSEIEEWDDVARLFGILNRKVHTGSSILQYLTGVFMDFDETQSQLRYTNAGHFDPAVIRADGTIDRLKGGGPPLGMFGSAEYPACDTRVQPNDLLVLFTDGFTDLRNTNNEFFGEERILHFVKEHRQKPLREIASLLLNEGMSFSSTPQPEDDLTLFLVRFR